MLACNETRKKEQKKVSTNVCTSHTYSFLANWLHFPWIDQFEH